MTDDIITRLAARGDGMTAAGRPVPLTAPGDRITPDGAIIAGPHRITPACRHYPACGGCQLQHVDDAAFADYLVARVRDALTAQQISPPPIRPPHLSPPGARRRATLHAERRGKDVILGYHEQGTNRIVPLRECPVLAPRLVALFAPLRTLLARIAAPRTRIKIQLDIADQGIAVLMGPCSVDGLAAHDALIDFATANGVARLAIDEGYGPEVRWAPEPATVTIGGVPVDLPLQPFLQATADGEAMLIDAVRAIIGPARRIADLFAGIGTFALSLPTQADIVAAEGARDALIALQQAANRARRPMKGQHRDLFRNPMMADELAAFDALVIDPPRAGAQAQFQAIADAAMKAHAPATIAAVSCNPATFARDVKPLLGAGYGIDWIQPVGQFRWATHVELVAQITRAK